MRKRVAVLISGRGTNMVALATAARDRSFPAEVALVLSNRPEASGLELARTLGLPACCVDHRSSGSDRAAHEAEVIRLLDANGVELICLAGWMRLLTPLLVDRYAGRMLNIHPSLLPAFPGLDTHARALRAGVKLHGCTVHVVTNAMDEGPILGQSAVPVLAHDTPDTLAARVLRQEHTLYPSVLEAFASSTSPHQAADDAALSNPLPVWRQAA